MYLLTICYNSWEFSYSGYMSKPTVLFEVVSNLIKQCFFFPEDIYNSNIAWLGVDIMGAVPFI